MLESIKRTISGNKRSFWGIEISIDFGFKNCFEEGKNA